MLRYRLRWCLGGRPLLEAFCAPTSTVAATSRAPTAPAHTSRLITRRIDPQLDEKVAAQAGINAALQCCALVVAGRAVAAAGRAITAPSVAASPAAIQAVPSAAVPAASRVRRGRPATLALQGIDVSQSSACERHGCEPVADCEREKSCITPGWFSCQKFPNCNTTENIRMQAGPGLWNGSASTCTSPTLKGRRWCDQRPRRPSPRLPLLREARSVRTAASMSPRRKCLGSEIVRRGSAPRFAIF